MRHSAFVIGELISIIIALMVLLWRPSVPPIGTLRGTYCLFALASISLVSLVLIGVHIISYWYSHARQNFSLLLWGLGFLIYSSLFLGICLCAAGLSWANMEDPETFFMFRQTMILFLVLNCAGVVIRITKNTWLRVGVSLSIGLSGYGIMIYGLLIRRSIELAMYLFSYILLIPVSVFMSYTFYLFSKYSGFSSAKIISISWIYYAVTYAFWAPLYPEPTRHLWFIAFSQFVLSIQLMLLGHMMLIPELKAEALAEKIEIMYP